MPTVHDARENYLLAALPADDFARLLPHLELVPMPLGQVLHESGCSMRHVYFPTDSIVSLPYVMEDGASADIAVVGNEGIVAVAVFMGGNTMREPANATPWSSASSTACCREHAASGQLFSNSCRMMPVAIATST